APAGQANRRKLLQQSELNAKRPAAEISAPGVHWIGVRIRYFTKSSPNATLFEQTLFGPIAGSDWRARTYRVRVLFGWPPNEGKP
ncbi:MAG: hypothetical protein NTW96_24445, partial [Planctomycetia bacterium]|nr:hypothetical protein [Planctomycetia bacterium]